MRRRGNAGDCRKRRRKSRPRFYWHLGDLRAIYTFDEDIQHQPEHIAKPLSIADYESIAWPDFIDSQDAPFGSIPFFVGMGITRRFRPLKTREDFLLQFADWLDTPVLDVFIASVDGPQISPKCQLKRGLIFLRRFLQSPALPRRRNSWNHRTQRSATFHQPAFERLPASPPAPRALRPAITNMIPRIMASSGPSKH